MRKRNLHSRNVLISRLGRRNDHVDRETLLCPLLYRADKTGAAEGLIGNHEVTRSWWSYGHEATVVASRRARPGHPRRAGSVGRNERSDATRPRLAEP